MVQNKINNFEEYLNNLSPEEFNNIIKNNKFDCSNIVELLSDEEIKDIALGKQ